MSEPFKYDKNGYLIYNTDNYRQFDKLNSKANTGMLNLGYTDNWKTSNNPFNEQTQSKLKFDRVVGYISKGLFKQGVSYLVREWGYTYKEASIKVSKVVNMLRKNKQLKSYSQNIKP